MTTVQQPHQSRPARSSKPRHIHSSNDSPQALAALYDVLRVVQQKYEDNSAAFRDGRLVAPSSYPAVKAAPGVQLAETITYFHSADVPAISLSALAKSLIENTPAIDVDTSYVALVLMHRHASMTSLHTTAHMMHRLFVASLLVAAKSTQDAFPSNALLSRTSGIVLRELNRLELTLMRDIHWTSQIRQADIDAIRALAAPQQLPQQRPAALICGTATSGKPEETSPPSMSSWLPDDRNSVTPTGRNASGARSPGDSHTNYNPAANRGSCLVSPDTSMVKAQ